VTWLQTRKHQRTSRGPCYTVPSQSPRNPKREKARYCFSSSHFFNNVYSPYSLTHPTCIRPIASDRLPCNLYCQREMAGCVNKRPSRWRKPQDPGGHRGYTHDAAGSLTRTERRMDTIYDQTWRAPMIRPLTDGLVCCRIASSSRLPCL
jgi:hypothetical protein